MCWFDIQAEEATLVDSRGYSEVLARFAAVLGVVATIGGLASSPVLGAPTPASPSTAVMPASSGCWPPPDEPCDVLPTDLCPTEAICDDYRKALAEVVAVYEEANGAVEGAYATAYQQALAAFVKVYDEYLMAIGVAQGAAQTLSDALAAVENQITAAIGSNDPCITGFPAATGGGYPATCVDSDLVDDEETDDVVSFSLVPLRPPPATSLTTTVSSGTYSLHASGGWATVRTGPDSFVLGEAPAPASPTATTLMYVVKSAHAMTQSGGTGRDYAGGLILGAYDDCGWVVADHDFGSKGVGGFDGDCYGLASVKRPNPSFGLQFNVSEKRKTANAPRECDPNCARGSTLVYGYEPGFDECAVLPAGGEGTCQLVTHHVGDSSHDIKWRYISAKNPNWAMVDDKSVYPHWVWMPAARMNRGADGRLPMCHPQHPDGSVC